MESLSDFTSANFAEAFLIYQNPAVDAETGPRPDGPTGWRACRDRLEMNSGGEVSSFACLEEEDAAVGKATAYALSHGANILHVECTGMDKESLESMVKRVPELQAFLDKGGKLTIGTDEITRNAPAGIAAGD